MVVERGSICGSTGCVKDNAQASGGAALPEYCVMRNVYYLCWIDRSVHFGYPFHMAQFGIFGKEIVIFLGFRVIAV